MAGERILVVDDEEVNREFLQHVLTDQGFAVTTAPDGSVALEHLKEGFFHVVLSDLKMPQMGGVELLHKIKEISPATVGIIFTGYASIETAVEAIKAGAYDYVTKPFRIKEVEVVLQRALEFQRLNYENFNLRKQVKAKYKFENIISSHDKMQTVFELVEKVSDSDSTVLI